MNTTHFLAVIPLLITMFVRGGLSAGEAGDSSTPNNSEGSHLFPVGTVFNKLPTMNLSDGTILANTADSHGNVFVLKKKRIVLSSPTDYWSVFWIENKTGGLLWLHKWYHFGAGTPVDQSLASAFWSAELQRMVITVVNYGAKGLRLTVSHMDPQGPVLAVTNTDKWPAPPTIVNEKLFSYDKDLTEENFMSIFPSFTMQAVHATSDVSGRGIVAVVNNHIFYYSASTGMWTYAAALTK